MERALQEADRALGNDGNIGLPYWDWLVTEVKGQVFPEVVRRIELPDDFFKSTTKNKLTELKYSKRASDSEIRRKLKAANLPEAVQGSLETAEHWMCASTEFTGNGVQVSVETPHNSVHVCCGYPMTVSE